MISVLHMYVVALYFVSSPRVLFASPTLAKQAVKSYRLVSPSEADDVNEVCVFVFGNARAYAACVLGESSPPPPNAPQSASSMKKWVVKETLFGRSLMFGNCTQKKAWEQGVVRGMQEKGIDTDSLPNTFFDRFVVVRGRNAF